MNYSVTKDGSHTIIQNSAFSYVTNKQWFDSDYWHKADAITGHAKGRATTWFFKFQQHEFVLRHYYRGGLIGKVVKDVYMGKELKDSRAYKEFKLLQYISTLHLPAPKPLAAHVVKKASYFYQADLITERIPNTKDLHKYLTKYLLTSDVWEQIGRVIAQFHNHGIYHDDLNIHNILIDNEKNIWLIDFDKGEVKAPAPDWQRENLSRLLRSFKKEKHLNMDLNWKRNDWNQLMSGYEQALK